MTKAKHVYHKAMLSNPINMSSHNKL